MSTFAIEYDIDGSSIIRYGPTGYAEWIMDINGITDIINCEFEWLRESDDPIGEVERLGDIIMAELGPIIFASEYYYCQHGLLTIMDILLDPANMYAMDEVAKWLLYRSFKKAGFKYAAECDMDELRKLHAHNGYDPYALSTKYRTRTYPDALYDTYSYDDIKKDNSAINEELLYHPRFAARWLDEEAKFTDYLT